MWAEFEWENKVNYHFLIILFDFQVGVVTPITDLRQYLDHLSAQTNMKLLTTDAALGIFEKKI